MAIPLSKPSVAPQGTLVNMNRNRQMLTRLQALRIGSVFPLLALPAELRLMIYDCCFNFNGIDKWFDDFWAMLETSTRPSKVKPPLVYRSSPAILRVCKQIYMEAREVLKKQSISFHHGLLDIDSLDNLINIDILSNITSITIDAKGHTILPKNEGLMGPSWRGHLDIIVDVSNALAKGHRLKTFTLDLTDKSMHAHVFDCWHKPIRCDFRDQLVEALDHLRKIRGVGKVNLIGIPPALIPGLTARMQSTPASFLDLPGEVRNTIYTLAADWSDISAHLTTTMRAWTAAVAAEPDYQKKQRIQPVYPPRSTPTILLLNKQIHAEAAGILRDKPLHLVLPAAESSLPHTQHTDTLNALKFIRPATLARVRHLRITIDSWEWIYSLDRFLPALAKHHSLQTLTFAFHDKLKGSFVGVGRAYPDPTLHLSLSALAKIRGVGEVRFEGDLPGVYTGPLRAIMESSPVVGECLPALMGVGEDGGSVAIEE